jgi:hypothetical protein
MSNVNPSFSNVLALPPGWPCFSMTFTFQPAFARKQEADNAENPLPIISTDFDGKGFFCVSVI